MSQRKFNQLWTFTTEPQFSLCLMGLKLLPLPLALGEITPGLVSRLHPAILHAISYFTPF